MSLYSYNLLPTLVSFYTPHLLHRLTPLTHHFTLHQPSTSCVVLPSLLHHFIASLIRLLLYYFTPSSLTLASFYPSTHYPLLLYLLPPLSLPTLASFNPLLPLTPFLASFYTHCPYSCTPYPPPPPHYPPTLSSFYTLLPLHLYRFYPQLLYRLSLPLPHYSCASFHPLNPNSCIV